MDVLTKLLQQRLKNARQPTGRYGRLLVRAMNYSHSQMTDWGLSHLTVGKQDRVLDIGCGGGGTLYKLAKMANHGKVYGIDFSEESVLASRATNQQYVRAGRVEIQQGSVSCLPFPDSMFDLVSAVNTHNYWPDLGTDLQEILRVLKPGGKIILIGSVYAGGKHDRRYQNYAALIEITFPSIDTLREAFVKAGFFEFQMFEENQRSWFCGIGRKSL